MQFVAQVRPGSPNTFVLPNWIEIQLVGEDDEAIANEPFRVQLPDGSHQDGVLDAAGRARVEFRGEGGCSVNFPRLGEDAWEAIDAK